jgi:hypothetical protein
MIFDYDVLDLRGVGFMDLWYFSQEVHDYLYVL